MHCCISNIRDKLIVGEFNRYRAPIVLRNSKRIKHLAFTVVCYSVNTNKIVIYEALILSRKIRAPLRPMDCFKDRWEQRKRKAKDREGEKERTLGRGKRRERSEVKLAIVVSIVIYTSRAQPGASSQYPKAKNRTGRKPGT
ncbi:hypothetical protein PUN28_001041 [Cardiocondyla obscurior]|uniref:Uncharacterized protein n=1 Tax=Cardiocondyla obscurior TaxID=286306 RepID=A0AAW2H2J9_9HYME